MPGRADFLVADAVPANQSPISLSSRPRKSPSHQPIIREIAGFWAVGPLLTLRKP